MIPEFIRDPTREEVPHLVMAVEHALRTTPVEYIQEQQVEWCVMSLRGVWRTLGEWVRSYMGEWTVDEILRWGAELDGIDKRLDNAMDVLKLRERIPDALGHVWPAIISIKMVWNFLDEKGLV